MRIINPSFEILKQDEGISGVLRVCELAGRVCYKSENLITEDSAYRFVEKMENNQHYSVLEHGTIYLTMPFTSETTLYIDLYTVDPYSRVNIKTEGNTKVAYITTNFLVVKRRALGETLNYMTSYTDNHEKRLSVRFITDRATSMSLLRHRVFSFSQESTRYCSYIKDKFGKEITIARPHWVSSDLIGQYKDLQDIDRLLSRKEFIFMRNILNSERDYFDLIDECTLPSQDARDILPHTLKTELIMTGFISDWAQVFKLRTANAAHPNVRSLTRELKAKLQDIKVLTSEYE